MHRRASLVATLLPLALLAACGSSGGSGADKASKFCELTAQYKSERSVGNDILGQADPPPAQVKSVFDQLNSQVQALVAAAPPEISADAKLLGEETSAFTALLAKDGYSFQNLQTDPEYKQNAEKYQDQKYADASNHVQEFMASRCNVVVTTPAG